MKDKEFEKFKAIIQEEFQIYGQLSETFDLGTYMCGMDAWCFMVDFEERFSVDLSGYDEDRFFHPEPNIIDSLKQLFGVKQSREQLTLEHLYKVAKKGQWFNPKNSNIVKE